MHKFSNKLIATVTLAAWGLILAISLTNGFLYGSPPISSIVPPIVGSLIGWFALIVTIVSIVKLYSAPDATSSSIQPNDSLS